MSMFVTTHRELSVQNGDLKCQGAYQKQVLPRGHSMKVTFYRNQSSTPAVSLYRGKETNSTADVRQPDKSLQQAIWAQD